MHRPLLCWTALTLTLALLLVACGNEEPPPDLSKANVIELVIGIIECETRHRSEPYCILTPSGAIVPAPAPGTKFTVAVGTDNVTIVQAHSGTVEIYANDEWHTIEAGEQTIVRPGKVPSLPAPVTPLDRDTYLQDPELGRAE